MRGLDNKLTIVAYWNTMNNICITGDSHFAHNNIIKYCHRPFLSSEDQAELDRLGGSWHHGNWKSSPWRISQESVELMNDELIKQTNMVVGRNDTLYHCGDFSMLPKDDRKLQDYYRRCRAIRDRINCQQIHLIHGNHDHPIISDLFESYEARTEFEHGGKLVVLNHYAQLIWNRSHRGSWHLYGHSHSEIEEWCNLHMPGRRSFDAGVDNAKKLLGAYRPFKFATDIVPRLCNKTGFSMNPHTPTDSTEPEEGN